MSAAMCPRRKRRIKIAWAAPRCREQAVRASSIVVTADALALVVDTIGKRAVVGGGFAETGVDADWYSIALLSA
jgi:hypothetical protein